MEYLTLLTYFFSRCHMCDYKTNKKNHLDRHIESHLKVNFPCKNTVVQSILTWVLDFVNRYCKIVILIKATPFACPICGFKSGRKDNLKQHIEKRHCSANTSIKQLEDMYPDMYKVPL